MQPLACEQGSLLDAEGELQLPSGVFGRFYLCESLRTNLTVVEAQGMPPIEVERELREEVASGRVDVGTCIARLIAWRALQQPAEARKSYRYLFDLAQIHLGNSVADDAVQWEPSEQEWTLVEELRKYVLCWALVSPKASEWFQRDVVEEFYLAARRQVRHPTGSNIFWYSVKLAQLHPVRLSTKAFVTRLDRKKLELCASIAYHMHLLCDGGTIKLPTELVGRVWGFEDVSARNFGSVILKALEEGGLITKTKKHVPGMLAAEFRFEAKRTSLFKPPA